MSETLRRSKSDRIIAGVAGGLAHYFRIDSSIVRLLWIILALYRFWLTLLLYIVMTILIPDESPGTSPTEPFADRLRHEVNRVADQARSSWQARPHTGYGQRLLGVLLLLVGSVFFLDILFPTTQATSLVLPVIVMIVGVALLWRRRV